MSFRALIVFALCGVLFWAVVHRSEPELYEWQGETLGASVSMRFYVESKRQGEQLMNKVVDEVSRLEQYFSLHKEDSLINQLNRDGQLRYPPEEFYELVQLALDYSAVTQGAFDITVQPLWEFYQAHFLNKGPQAKAPSSAKIRTLRRLVDYRQVQCTPKLIRLAPNQRLTLDSLAQGYITDRVAQLFLDAGIKHALIDFGEVRAIGAKPDHTPWQIDIRNPNDASKVLTTVSLVDEAMSTTSGYGAAFSWDGTHHHLIDPKTGRSPDQFLSVTVFAKRAVIADILSTSFTTMSPKQLASFQLEEPVSALFVKKDMSLVRKSFLKR